MNDKLLTIVVPIYNTEKYLAKCLNSIVYCDNIDVLDIILVSDGSKDASIDIMKEYQSKYEESIRIIDKENGGHGSTINAGLKIAQGKYFRVLDSDDWFDLIDFDKLLDYLKTTDVDLVLTNQSKEFVNNGISTYEFYGNENIEYGKIYEFDKFDDSYFKDIYFYMATSTYKLSVLKEANLQLSEKCFYVDMQYNLQPIPYIKTFVFLELDVYRYFIGRADQSVNSMSYVRNYNDHEKVVLKQIESFQHHRNSLSDVKLAYLRRVMHYFLFSHYLICIQYDDDKKRAQERISKFDKVFKNLSPDLYGAMGKRFELFRKTNFVFIRYPLLERVVEKVYNMLKGT